MNIFDTIVIGAGPIGLTAANEIAKNGFNVCVVERRPKIGYPSHCSGLVSTRFVEENHVNENLILNHIKGAYLTADGKSLSFKDKKAHAIVIDREKFDQSLAEQAEKNRVKILKNSQIVSAKKHKSHIELQLQNGKTLSAKFVVVASGAKSGVNRMLGFSEKTAELIYTVQADTEVSLPDREIVYMSVSKNFAHNWFAWIIPTDKTHAHIGLGTDKTENILKNLDEFIRSCKYTKGVDIKKLAPVAWIIPIGLAKSVVSGRAIRVGDAAMHVKPFSGGGLHTGIKSAHLAAEAVIGALKTNDPALLRKYADDVEIEINPIIKRGLLLRKIYRSMSESFKAFSVEKLPFSSINAVSLKTTLSSG
jgi:digeranylgeranylglycerophospholipid reductase